MTITDLMNAAPTRLELQPREARKVFRHHRRGMRAYLSTLPDEKSRFIELVKFYKSKSSGPLIFPTAEEEGLATRYPSVKAYAAAKIQDVQGQLDALDFSSIHDGSYIQWAFESPVEDQSKYRSDPVKHLEKSNITIDTIPDTFYHSNSASANNNTLDSNLNTPEIINSSETVQHHTLPSVHVSRFNRPWLNHQDRHPGNTTYVSRYEDDHDGAWAYSSLPRNTVGDVSPSIHDSPYVSFIRRNTAVASHNRRQVSFAYEFADSAYRHHQQRQPSAGSSQSHTPLGDTRSRLIDTSSRSGSADINYTTHRRTPSLASGAITFSNSSEDFLRHQQEQPLSSASIAAQQFVMPFFDATLPSPYIDPFIDSPHTVSDSPVNSAFIYNNSNNTNPTNSGGPHEGTSGGPSDSNSGNSLLTDTSSLLNSMRIAQRYTIDTSPLYTTRHNNDTLFKNSGSPREVQVDQAEEDQAGPGPSQTQPWFYDGDYRMQE